LPCCQASFLNTENIACNRVLVGIAKGLIKISGLLLFDEGFINQSSYLFII